MAEESIERSESGAPIYRYDEREREFELAESDPEALERIEEHLDKFLGTERMVWHEIISDLIHVDVHIASPTSERNFYTLVTTGMSDKPMNSPEQDLRYAELLICLPPDWQLPKEGEFLAPGSKDEHYAPIQWLKYLARMPHEYNTWLGFGHTIPNGDPPSPFTSHTQLCCALLLEPVLFGEGFTPLRIRDDKVVNFLSLVPIYKEEMEFKLNEGVEALLPRFDEHNITELLDLKRKNVCKPRFH